MKLDLYRGRFTNIFLVLDDSTGWPTTNNNLQLGLQQVTNGWPVSHRPETLELPLICSIENYSQDRLEEIYQEIQMYLLME